MTNEERLELFKNELSLIKKNHLREFAEGLLTHCNDYFFTMPASTSGKYHPLFSLGDGGLVRHTKAVVYFLNEILRSNLFGFTQDTNDALLVAAIAHDIKKAGNDGSQHTVKEHPRLAVEFIEQCNEECGILTEEELRTITKAVHSHMGIWGAKDYLPVPNTTEEKVLHLADLMASRKELSLSIFSPDEGVTERHSIDETTMPFDNKPSNPGEFTMPFGKYRGKTLAEIDIINDGYIPWALTNMTNAPDIVETMKAFKEQKQ